MSLLYADMAQSQYRTPQGVAFSASKLKLPATIVMPVATPAIKVDAVRRLGGKYATVVLHGK